MANEPPANFGNYAGYARDFIAEGVGPTEALRILREQGMGVRDQRWYDVYGQVRDTIAREPGFLALNPYQLPDSSDYGTWMMGKGGQYATTVEVQLLDRGTGLMVTQQTSYITDTPHTGVEAQEGIMDQFGGFDQQQDYGKTVMGALATHYYVTVPWGSS